MEPEYRINKDGEFIRVQLPTSEPLTCSEEDYEWLNSWLDEDGYADDDYLNY